MDTYAASLSGGAVYFADNATANVIGTGNAIALASGDAVDAIGGDTP